METMAFGAMRIAMPPVGAGSSQREDSPAHRLPHRPLAHTIQPACPTHDPPGFYYDATTINRAAARHVATNTAPPPPPRHPPTCALLSSYLGRCTLGFHAKIRGCSGPGRAMVGRRYGGIRGNGRGHTGLHGSRIRWGSAFVATWRAASRLIIPASRRLCGRWYVSWGSW